jgi:hypothetical protein
LGLRQWNILSFFPAPQAACNAALREYCDPFAEGEGPEIVNCNAHVSLAITKAVLQRLAVYERDHQVFEDTSFFKTSASSSMFESALYAVTKLFSYSHVNLTYTKSGELDLFLVKESLAKETPMKPADSARFGRLSENSFNVLKSLPALLRFLDEVGGETNLLTMKVQEYLNTPWFKVAAAVVVYISQLTEYPLLQALHVTSAEALNFIHLVDPTIRTSPRKHKKASTHAQLLNVYDTMHARLERCASGEFETGVVNVLLKLVDADTVAMAKRLLPDVARDVWAAVDHQISPLYGAAGRVRLSPERYAQAPTTNLRCEGAASWVGLALRSCASVAVVSEKRIISQGDIFDREAWAALTSEERMARLRSTHTDPKFIEARKIIAEWRKSLQEAKLRLLAKKAQDHVINTAKLGTAAAACQAWGGPITSALQVDALTDSQVRAELACMRKRFPPKAQQGLFREHTGKGDARAAVPMDTIKRTLKDFLGHKATSGALTVQEMLRCGL